MTRGPETPVQPAVRRRVSPRALLVGLMGLLTLQGGFSLLLRLVTVEADILHPAIHLCSGATGLALAGRRRLFALYSLAFGMSYLSILGVGGALGLVGGRELPLAPPDHVFHILLGSAVSAAALQELPSRERLGARSRSGKLINAMRAPAATLRAAHTGGARRADRGTGRTHAGGPPH